MERLAGLIAWAELRGRDRGLRGASGAWLAVWVLATAYKRLRAWTGPDPVVVREVLAPGQQLVITHFPKGTESRPGKTRRKKGAKKPRKRKR